jgi:hypothetical protein
MSSSASSSFRRRCEVRTSISSKIQLLESLFRLQITRPDHLTFKFDFVCHRSLYIAQIRPLRRSSPDPFSNSEFDSNILVSAVDPKNTGILIRCNTADDAIRSSLHCCTWTCWRLMINCDRLAVIPSLALALLGEPVPPYSDVSLGNLLNGKHHALRELSPSKICETAKLRKYFLTVDSNCVGYGLIRIKYDLWIGARMCPGSRHVSRNSPTVSCL